VHYSGWYGYRNFSDGPVPGFGSHLIDLIHYITGAQYPIDSVCLGGTFIWNDEHKFTCPDHVQALWTYPDFMVSYSTNFGNSWGNSLKFFGETGSLDVVHWNNPILTAEGGIKDKGAIRGRTPVEPVDMPDHFLDWLQCIRSRQQPNAPIEAGYQHAVAVIMAMMAYDSGKRMVFNPEERTIKPA